MANGQVEVHDPFSNSNNVKSSTDYDPKSTSDTSGMGDTVEFRILMAYATRRRPKKDVESPAQDSPVVPNGNTDSKGKAPSQTPAKTERKLTNKKKKKGFKSVLQIFKCVKPQTEEEPHQTNEESPIKDRCFDSDNDEVIKEDEFGEIAARLSRIADEIPFIPPELESDSVADDDADVEKLIGLILRESGDKLNEKELKDANIAKELFWNYSFFKALITGLLRRMGLRSPNPDSPGPHASPKTQIAVTCEATSRLSAMDTQPMNKLLGFGAKYLNEYYSSWIQQQGGYEAAFESDDEDDFQ